MTTARLTDDAELTLTASPTAHLLDELALYGHRPHDDETDPRPLPEPAKLRGALADMFDALVATLSDTRLEPDLQTLLWSVVNVFHRRIDRIERDLDDNERAQRTGQREQDGSEVRSLELERLVAQGLTLIERRNSFEFIRDAAAELYGLHTGQAWRRRAGSMVNRVTMTAAMIDSREFINARRRADAQVLLPKGTRIAFAGGVECNDHQRIWAVLDKVIAKHSDMVLLHGGTPRGAEKIAACWADARKVGAGRIQAGLDAASEGGPVQAQRPAAGGPADRRRRVPGLRRHR
jgi:SLOG family YspA-like protein